MRTWLSPLVGILLIFATVAGIPATAQEGQPGPPENEESSGPGNSNASSNGKGNSDTARASWPECREAFESDENVSEPGHECYRYYRQAGEGRSDRAQHVREYQDEYEEEHADERARAEALKHTLGLQMPAGYGVPGFTVNATGYHNEHVSFVPSVQNHTIYDVRINGHLVIEEIRAPGPVDPDERLLRGNDFQMHGMDGWKLHIWDTKRGGMIAFDADEENPFLVTLPAEVQVTWLDPVDHATIEYSLSGLSATVNRSGDAFEPVPPSTENNTTLGPAFLAWGQARFFVDWASVPDQPNNHSALMKKAQVDGHLGAEVEVRRGSDEGSVAAFTTVFHEMELEFESADLGPVTGAPGSIYTITVDSPAHEGKTIALNLESGLVTAESLVFRYYNVHPNATIPATIVQADDVHDVLDPLDDGVVAEWWVIEDINGVQVLISIPHFSIHKIEMQNLGEIIIEQPSLVLGVIGALLVVGAATRAMFRRPTD